jgi:hypothetical protein
MPIPSNAGLLAFPPDDLYAAIACDRVVEVLRRRENLLAQQALGKIAKACRTSEREIAGLVAELLLRRAVLAGRKRKRNDEKMIRALDELVDYLILDQNEAIANGRVFNYPTVTPGGDAGAVFIQVRGYLEVRRALESREALVFGLTRKTTPERAAVGAFAAAIEARARVPLDDAVVDLLAPFIDEAMDSKAVRRCRDAFKRRLRPTR